MADVTKTLKDALYVTVGIGVISVRQARERRQALRKQVETQLSGTNEQLQKLADRARQAAKDAQGQLQNLSTPGLNARNRTSKAAYPSSADASSPPPPSRVSGRVSSSSYPGSQPVASWRRSGA